MGALRLLRWLLRASALCLPALGVRPLAEAIDRGVGPRHGRYAFVMLAADPPGRPPTHIWGALAMASALKRLSSYPLVLLTNMNHFPDGTDLAQSLRRLNVRVRPVEPVPISEALMKEHRVSPGCEHNSFGCAAQYLKLQIWRLTEYEKLIWMDSDAILTRSVDGLFSRKGTWAQQDNWDCGNSLLGLLRFSPSLLTLTERYLLPLGPPAQRQESSSVCSGILIVEPSEATYKEMVRFMGTLSSAPGGDQEVVERFFREVKGERVQLLDVNTASFGQCWQNGLLKQSMPSFVHKSDRENACFRVTDDAACLGDPLGVFWRDRLCDAVATAGLKDSALAAFCSSRPRPS